MTSAALQPPCQTAAASPPRPAVRLHPTMRRSAPMLQTQLQSIMRSLGCSMKTWTPGQQTQRQCHLNLLLLQRKHLCRLQNFTRAVTSLSETDCQGSDSLRKHCPCASPSPFALCIVLARVSLTQHCALQNRLQRICGLILCKSSKQLFMLLKLRVWRHCLTFPSRRQLSSSRWRYPQLMAMGIQTLSMGKRDRRSAKTARLKMPVRRGRKEWPLAPSSSARALKPSESVL